MDEELKEKNILSTKGKMFRAWKCCMWLSLQTAMLEPGINAHHFVVIN